MSTLRGNSNLAGGTGADTYLFGRGAGQDKIDDHKYQYNAAQQPRDTLCLGADITKDQLSLCRVNSDLEVSIISTSAQAVIQNWYSGSAYQLEQFKTEYGRTLYSDQVDNLVAAIAAFFAPAVVQTTFPKDYEAALIAVSAANWE